MLGGAESSRDYFTVSVDCGGGFVQLINDVAGKIAHVTKCTGIVYGVAAAGRVDITDTSALKTILYFPTDVLGSYSIPRLIQGITLTPGEGVGLTKPVAAGIYVIVEGYYTLRS